MDSLRPRPLFCDFSTPKERKTSVHFSSNKDNWETPQSFYDTLDEEFKFDLDPCCTVETAKCKSFMTVEDDGLNQDWFGTVFMNPPYGRKIGGWVKKAYNESTCGCTVVCLLPARTDTAWFHDYCYRYGEIRFIRGRLRFGGAKNSAPFPSMVVIFRGGVMIRVNKIKCNKCGDVIESTCRHDFKHCKCGRVAIDGGKDYLKRSFQEVGDYTELSLDEKKHQPDNNSNQCSNPKPD